LCTISPLCPRLKRFANGPGEQATRHFGDEVCV
jgi:hypothetical protein